MYDTRGCTKYLQPLDISVNRSLKCRLKDEYCKAIQSTVSKERHVSMAKEKMDMIIKNVKKAAYDIERKVILNGWRRMQEVMEGGDEGVKS